MGVTNGGLHKFGWDERLAFSHEESYILRGDYKSGCSNVEQNGGRNDGQDRLGQGVLVKAESGCAAV